MEKHTFSPPRKICVTSCASYPPTTDYLKHQSPPCPKTRRGLLYRWKAVRKLVSFIQLSKNSYASRLNIPTCDDIGCFMWQVH